MVEINIYDTQSHTVALYSTSQHEQLKIHNGVNISQSIFKILQHIKFDNVPCEYERREEDRFLGMPW